METLKLHWLGQPLIERGGMSIKLETRKATALLAYLSLQPGACQREILATMFWGEQTQPRALANLRRTLASLNSSLPGCFEANHGTIALKRNSRIWVDAEAFQHLFEQYQEHAHSDGPICEDCLAGLQEMLQLYRGDFLEGLNLGNSPTFDEWQLLQREDLRAMAANGLQRLASGYSERGQWEQAILHARHRVALDQWNEAAHRALMDLYIGTGQRGAALRQYQELERLLKEQLGQTPEAATLQLFEQLRGGKKTESGSRSTGHSASHPLLKTKLYIPSAPASRVVRAHLIAHLAEAENQPLTIISAPAGFGKTTLLVEWATQTPLSVAWLSLDNGDNDPYRFISYLIAALESLHENIGREARRIMQAPKLAPPHILLASLINDLGALHEPYALVLDDYQNITEHAVHEVMAYLLDHLPATMHLVLSTRADPPLRLGRLRAHGQMLEIRTRDLRFTPEEATEFLNDVMRLGLSMREIEILETRTEGWVVGLKMAALSLQGHENAPEFIRAFSGSHRYILDYLVEEVLRRQPARIISFLLETSILEKLSASLCDALMGEEWKHAGENSQTVLEYLEHSNLFLIPLDDERIWYRYHPLFADLLRARLQAALNPQDIAQFHARAADWHGQYGSIVEAIHHASMASDDERVEHYIEQNYRELVRRGEQSWLRYWTGTLNQELVYHRPWLCIYEAYSHSWFGELEPAEQLLEKAEKHVQAAGPGSDLDSMKGYIAYVRSRIVAMRGDIQHAIELCRLARKTVPADNIAMQLDTRITLGYEYFLCGDFANARPILEEMLRSGMAAGAVINTVAAACILARLTAIQGQWQEAYEMYQTASRSIPDANGQHLGARALVEIGTAEILYEWNQLDPALERVKRGLSLLPLWGKTDDNILALLTLARIQLARSDLRSATDSVQEATQLAQTGGIFPEARMAVEPVQVKVWLAQGDIRSVGRWAASRADRYGSGEPLGFESEAIGLAEARAYIALERPREAVELLSHLEGSARQAGRSSRLVEILLLKALAMQAMGATAQAEELLAKSLSLAETGGQVRVFLNEGMPMENLLRSGQTHGAWREKGERAQAEKVLKEFQRSI